MRVAYVLDQLLPNSGADTEQAIHTISGLERHGVEVVLYLPRPLREPGVTSTALRSYYKVTETLPVRHLRTPLAHSRAVAKVTHPIHALTSGELGGYDAIYTRNIPTLFGLAASPFPFFYETYRPWMEEYPLLKPVFRAAMRRKNFAGAVLHSDYARGFYSALGIDDRKLEVVYNGFWPSLFEPRMTRAEARAAIGVPEDGPIAVYSGRVNPQKGLGIVLDMARRNPDVRFLLVGSEGDGPIEAQARRLDNVRVFGWTTFDQLAPYLYASDVLIIPPSSIPLKKVGNTVLPIKLFGYLAAGRAILAPRSPDTAELLRHRENAYLVTPDDLDTASAGLRELVADNALAESLASACRALADTLTWDARGLRLRTFMEARMAAL